MAVAGTWRHMPNWLNTSILHEIVRSDASWGQRRRLQPPNTADEAQPIRWSIDLPLRPQFGHHNST